jgi:hypothetical protein
MTACILPLLACLQTCFVRLSFGTNERLLKQNALIALTHILSVCLLPVTQHTLQAESLIKDHIPINGFIGFKKLMEILTTKGISAQTGALAVRALVERGTLRRRQEGKLLQRAQQ